MQVIRWIENELGRYFDPHPYLEVLPELVKELPSGAAAFAADPDHYYFYCERCVKDLKLVSVVFSQGDDGVSLVLGFSFNDLAAVEDLEVAYSGVREFEIKATVRNPSGLWDMMLDEVMPHEEGASHEMVFMGGRVWVVCRDLEARWLQPGSVQPGVVRV